jgi:hypothetical protein
MKMRTRYLASALVALALPLSVATALAFTGPQSAAAVEHVRSFKKICPAGTVWEPAGYMGNGHWRPAHCASRQSIPF